MIYLTESLSSQQRFELWTMSDQHGGYILGMRDIDTIHDTNLMYPIFSDFVLLPQDNIAFIDLLARIGFTNVQANAIIGEGIMDPEDLVTYAHSDTKTFFKHLSNRHVHPPFASQHKFQIMRYWVEKRIPLGLDVDVEFFTNGEMVIWGEKMKAAADEKDAQRPAIAVPGAYKKDTKWREGKSSS